MDWYVYTDGSYGNDGKTHGGIVFADSYGKVLSTLHVVTSIRDFVKMNNIGGEILAAWSAIFSVATTVKQMNENVGIDSHRLQLVYDLQGVGMWLQGWKTNERGTRWYKETIKKMLSEVPNLTLELVWVKGHKDTRLNVVADAVASYSTQGACYNATLVDMDEMLRSDYNFV